MLGPLAWRLAAAITASTASTGATGATGDAASIDRVMAEDARQARLWYTSWTAFYTVATGFSIKVVLDSGDRDRRVASAVDGIRSGLGLVTTVLFVPPSMAAPPLADGDVTARERWLEETAGAERLGRSFLAHAANAAVNAAGGGYLWLHEHRFAIGLLAFVSGTLIGELKIWTQPTLARDAFDARTARSTVQLAFAPMASATAFGFALDGRF
jgi:hypothetical protein